MERWKGKRCIVIGAGVAGMSAAVHCAKNDMHVIVVESKPYIGGRAHSFVDQTTEETIDNGQHLMMGCYHAFLSLLKTLGTEHLLEKQHSLRVAFYDADGSRDVLEEKHFHGQLGALEGILGLQHIGIGSKLRAIVMLLRIRLGIAGSVSMSCNEFLMKHRQPREIITRLWEPLILATLNSSSEHAAASLFVEVLRRSILAGGTNSALLIPRVPLASLFESFSEWLTAHGAELHTSTQATELVMMKDRAIGISTADQKEIRADAVIMAVPPKALRRIISQEKLNLPSFRLTQNFSHSAIVSLYLWFDKDFIDEDFCALLNTSTQWVFNRRRLCDPDSTLYNTAAGHISLTVSAAQGLAERSSHELVQHCLKELHDVFPASRSARLLHYKVIKEREATVLFDTHTEQLRPDVTSGIPGVFIAGDWTHTGLPATLEGAAQSGIAAANAMLNSF